MPAFWQSRIERGVCLWQIPASERLFRCICWFLSTRFTFEEDGDHSRLLVFLFTKETVFCDSSLPKRYINPRTSYGGLTWIHRPPMNHSMAFQAIIKFCHQSLSWIYMEGYPTQLGNDCNMANPRTSLISIASGQKNSRLNQIQWLITTSATNLG